MDKPPKGELQICAVLDCEKLAVAKRLCRMHYARVQRGIDPTAPRRAPNGQAQWRIDKRGYRVKSGGSRGANSIAEHREVMKQKLGRDLLPHEEVHHINGVKHDNRPENLELWSTSQPAGQRVEDKIAWAEELLRTYGRKVT